MAIFVSIYTTNQSSSCLRDSRNDADFIPNSRIDEAGFARARPTEERDISDMSRERGSHNRIYYIRGAYITIKWRKAIRLDFLLSLLAYFIIFDTMNPIESICPTRKVGIYA